MQKVAITVGGKVYEGAILGYFRRLNGQTVCVFEARDGTMFVIPMINLQSQDRRTGSTLGATTLPA